MFRPRCSLQYNLFFTYCQLGLSYSLKAENCLDEFLYNRHLASAGSVSQFSSSHTWRHVDALECVLLWRGRKFFHFRSVSLFSFLLDDEFY